MARCPNGHEQKLGVNCATCGAPVSYREDVLHQLGTLESVEPDFGRLAVVNVGFAGLTTKRADYLAAVGTAPQTRQSCDSFLVTAVKGGNWLDFGAESAAFERWWRLVGLDKSEYRFVVVDTTNPLSVMVLSSIPEPRRGHTVIIALAADKDSTAAEQNTSYVSLSVSIKRNLPMLVFSKSYMRNMLFFTDETGLATVNDALSRLLDLLLVAADALVDMLERDVKLGVRIHGMSAIISGNRNVYGGAGNVYVAQSFGTSVPVEEDSFKTLYSICSGPPEVRAEFDKAFVSYRSNNKRLKALLSAEFHFQEGTPGLYDLLVIYGLEDGRILKDINEGYRAIVRNVPRLTVEEAID